MSEIDILDVVDIEESEDAPEIVARPIERTKPLYPSDPADIESIYDSIRQYQRDVREKEARKAADKADAAGSIEILEFAHDIEPRLTPGAPGTLAKRLVDADWEVDVQRSLVHVGAVRFLNDSEEGADRPHHAGDIRYEAHDLETLVVLGVKRAGQKFLAVEATWERKHREGKSPTSDFRGAKTYDPILGQEWRTTQKAPRAQYDWEKEEGASGALGLGQWIDIMAPRPQKTDKKEESDAA